MSKVKYRDSYGKKVSFYRKREQARKKRERKVRRMAEQCNWNMRIRPDGTVVLWRYKVDIHIKLYPLINVVTRLYHPKSQEVTKLFRHDINIDELRRILINPRAHTDKGTYIM